MIEILSSGISTSIQDLGRHGYRKYGVPISGPMDVISANNANRILGNHPSCSLLEFMLQGPILLFNQATTIVISGAAQNPVVNSKTVPCNTPIQINEGDILKMGRCQTGMYGYLGICGGFTSDIHLNSMSFYNGITSHIHLSKKDRLSFNLSEDHSIQTNEFVDRFDFDDHIIIAEKGPDYGLLDASTITNLHHSTFTITNEINRMGYKIDSSTPLSASEIITAPVQPGTVQLTPSGKLIVLMSDCQTTGGYSRILQLNTKNRSILAQKRVGSSFTLKIKS